MAETWFYAVRCGRTPGIYRTWERCWAQIQGYPHAAWTKFRSYQEAQDYIHEIDDAESDANLTVIETIDMADVISSTPAVNKTSSSPPGSASSPITILEDDDTLIEEEKTPNATSSNGISRHINKRRKKSGRNGNKGKVSLKIRNPKCNLKSIIISDASSDEDDLEFIENPLKESQLNRTSSEEFFKVGTSDKEVAVGVFWDIENISLPSGFNPAIFVTKVREMFANDSSRYCEKNFYVVCDVWRESKFVMKQLHEFHVRIIHVPALKQNSSDNVLRDLMNEFVNYNKYSRIVLISGDSDFSHDIHNFRRNKKCECILVHNQQAKESLIKSANKAYLYQDLIGISQDGNTSKQRGKKRKWFQRLQNYDDNLDESFKKQVYYRSQKKKMRTPRKRTLIKKFSKQS